MARTDSHLDRLRSVPVFHRLDRRELEAVSRLTTEIDFEAGAEIIREGASSHEVLIVTDGEAVVSKGGQEVARLGPGDVAGELGLVQDRPRNATVRAETPLRALVIDRREFHTLLDDVPALTKKLLFTVAARLGDATPDHV